MYQSIVVCQFMLCEKTTMGNVPIYNNVEKYIKVISGTTKEECQRLVDNFLKENDFKGMKNERSCN